MSKLNLLCFPFAGGSKYSYKNFNILNNFGTNVVPIDYPGRGARLSEPLLTDFDTLLDNLMGLFDKDSMPHCYILFGHSMGGIIAWMLAVRLYENGFPPPKHLIVSGTAAPSHCNKVKKNRHLLNRVEFKQEIRNLNGCPEEVLENEELFSFYEPILRADFQVVETFTYRISRPLDIPITVINGNDEEIDQEEVQAWEKESSKRVEFKTLPGDHFFLYSHFNLLSPLLENIIKTYI